jgi:hypothetical protein
MREVVSRIQNTLADRVCWTKVSDIASQYLAASTVRFDSTATRREFTVTVTSPFDTDVLTVSIPAPWPLDTDPAVTLDGAVLPAVPDASALHSGTFLRRGAIITVSISAQRNASRTIRVALPS